MGARGTRLGTCAMDRVRKRSKESKDILISRCHGIDKAAVSPQMVKKGQTRLAGTDRQNPQSLRSRHDHARYSGATARPGRAWRCHPHSCANVTEAVMDEVHQWQIRPLEPV